MPVTGGSTLLLGEIVSSLDTVLLSSANGLLTIATSCIADGGVRDPAADYGLHAIRSSYDFDSLEGVKISSE